MLFKGSVGAALQIPARINNTGCSFLQFSGVLLVDAFQVEKGNHWVGEVLVMDLEDLAEGNTGEGEAENLEIESP